MAKKVEIKMQVGTAAELAKVPKENGVIRANTDDMSLSIDNSEFRLAGGENGLDSLVSGLDGFVGSYGVLYEPPLASDEWKADAATGRVLNISTAQFLALFYDGLIGNHDNGYTVTKTSLGKDQSNAYDIYEYDFKPANYSKTILLSSGLHPYELPASFGLAHFMNHLMQTPYLHEGFKYIRENVRIKVVPVCNPWGFNQNPKKYGNVNGVNLNRNWDIDGRWDKYPVYTPAQNEWNVKGSAPFSEKETQIFRDWATANKSAAAWIDCHTGLKNDAFDIWFIYTSADPRKDNYLACADLLAERIKLKYGRTATKNIVADSEGSIRQFYSVGALGLSTMTIEFAEKNWGDGVNNTGITISEYEALIGAYTFMVSGFFTGAFNKNVGGLSKLLKYLELSQHQIDILSGAVVSEPTEPVEPPDEPIEPDEPVEPGDIIASDNFERADGVLTGTVTTAGSKTWVQSSDASGSSERMKIVSGKAFAYASNANSHGLIDVGSSDHDVSVDGVWDAYVGVYVRTSAITNKSVLVRINATSLTAFEYLNSTTSRTIGTYAFTPVKGQKYVLRVVAKGTAISVYLDDVLRISGTISETGYTLAGMRSANDTVSSFDNFEVRRA